MSKDKPTQVRHRVKGTLYREASIRADGIVDEEARIVDLTFSSEDPYLRSSYFDEPWFEVLGHKRGEADLARLNTGGTLHYNHNRTRDDRLGKVVSASIKGHRGQARVQFSSHERVDDVWNDVRDGILTNVSVAYKINEKVLVRAGADGEPDTYRVTAWVPMEISVVDIPADVTVGIGRGDGQSGQYELVRLDEDESIKEESSMLTEAEKKAAISAAEAKAKAESDAKAAEAARVAAGGDAPVDAPVGEAEQARAVEAARLAGVQAEQTRHTEIRGAMVPLKKLLGEGYQELLEKSLEDPQCTLEQVRAEVLTRLGAAEKAASSVIIVEHDAARITETMVDALDMRCFPVSSFKDVAERKAYAERGGHAFKGCSLVDMARACLESGGADTKGMPKMDMVGRAFSTSNFPQILEDSANKSMLKGFMEAEETWQMWAQTGNLSDFKVSKRVALSSFDALSKVREGEEYQYGIFQEEGESIALFTYGKLFSITRQTIINDDLNMFMRIPMGMGRAASRLVGDVAYGVLAANPNMSDGKPMFDAAHNNIAANGDVPNVASVTAMRIQMAKQKDVSEAATALNIRPAYMLTPLALETQAMILMMAEFDPRGGPQGAHAAIPNPTRGMMTVCSDVRLDNASESVWYMAAGKQFDTIELAFLDGEVQPTMEQQRGWTVDGMEYKVRQDVGVAPLSYRTWVRNPGA